MVLPPTHPKTAGPPSEASSRSSRTTQEEEDDDASVQPTAMAPHEKGQGVSPTLTGLPMPGSLCAEFRQSSIPALPIMHMPQAAPGASAAVGHTIDNSIPLSIFPIAADKFAICVCGLPGVGKTHIARRLARYAQPPPIYPPTHLLLRR